MRKILYNKKVYDATYYGRGSISTGYSLVGLNKVVWIVDGDTKYDVSKDII